MKMSAIALAASLLVGGGSAVSAWEFQPGHFVSGNINLTTDYIFRGVSQTDGNPAVQGGFDYLYAPYSIYAGVWASNVDSNYGKYFFEDEVSGAYSFTAAGMITELDERGVNYRDDLDGDGISDYEQNISMTVLNPAGYEGASMETDFYLGWAPSVKTDYGIWNFDLGYKRYQYFGIDNSDINTNEFHGSVGFDYFNRVKIGYTANYSDKYFGLDSAWYHDFQLGIPLDEIIDYPGWEIHANYGMTRYSDGSIGDGVAVVLPVDSGFTRPVFTASNLDYDDYGVGVSYKSEGWKVDLSWIDRTKKEQCGSPFKCESTAVFTVGRSF